MQNYAICRVKGKNRATYQCAKNRWFFFWLMLEKSTLSISRTIR